MAQGVEPRADVSTVPFPAGDPSADPNREQAGEVRTTTADLPPRHPIQTYVITAVLALGFGAAGAYGERHLLEPTPPAAAEADAEAPEAPEAPAASTATSASTSPVASESADHRQEDTLAQSTRHDLDQRISRLSEQVDNVNHRLETWPKPEPAPDLSSLQVRVAEIGKTVGEVPALQETVKRLSDRLEELGHSVHALGDQFHNTLDRHGIRPKLPAAGGSDSADPGRSQRDRHAHALAPPSALGRTAFEEAIEQGANLFHLHKFQEAFELFTKMEQTNPDDARVWYYAALSHGMAVHQWTADGTGRLVEKGIERERAGTPSRSVIDQTFKGLTSDTGKDWLAAYRKRVDMR